MEIKKENLEKLSVKQHVYFKIMSSKKGVLYLKSRPGVGKTATIAKLAEKLDMNFIPVHLSIRDEAEIGGYPDKEEVVIGGHKMFVMKYALPEWAVSANERPTIVLFDEFNRAQLAQRNASLQILNERRLGENFKFNDNVLMVACGNLGEDDNCDVDELDDAMKNRFITIKHEETLKEWIKDFGKENVHNSIIRFLKGNEEFFYRKDNEFDDSFATPRSWTNLSGYIEENYGLNSKIEDFIEDMRIIARGYIGETSSQRFVRFLDDDIKFNLNDVLNNFDKISDLLKESMPDKKLELLYALKERNLVDLNNKQKNNLKKFLATLNEEAVVSYMTHVLDKEVNYLTEEDEVDENNLKIEEFFEDNMFTKYKNSISLHQQSVQNSDDEKTVLNKVVEEAETVKA
jgi:ATP-dependent Lon protease